MAVVQNQWCHFGAPLTLEPILVVGLGCSLGALDFDSWPYGFSELRRNLAAFSGSLERRETTPWLRQWGNGWLNMIYALILDGWFTLLVCAESGNPALSACRVGYLRGAAFGSVLIADWSIPRVLIAGSKTKCKPWRDVPDSVTVRFSPRTPNLSLHDCADQNSLAAASCLFDRIGRCSKTRVSKLNQQGGNPIWGFSLFCYTHTQVTSGCQDFNAACVKTSGCQLCLI